MRIAHIVNVVDDVGSYGGPLRVALNQVAALRRRGHDVVLVAGGEPSARRDPQPVAGDVPVRLVRSWNVGRTAGFATRWAPGVHWWLIRHARRSDAVHVHLGRDLTTAPAAVLLRLMRVPYVVQTHGMIAPSSRRLAGIIDALLVRFALRGASRVLLLTEIERGDLEGVMPGENLPYEVLPNGVAVQAKGPASSGAAGSELPEVLFLSRLHERKRPVNFVRAAALLRAKGVRARFAVVGPDEGELPGVRAAIVEAGDPEDLITYEGVAPMSGSIDRFAAADVFVLPAVQEPFSMALAEAMSVGVPVVCCRSCGLAPRIAEADAGIVVPDDDVPALADAVLALVDDEDRRRSRGANGLRLVSETFSIDAVAARLEGFYAAAPAGPGGGTSAG